ncbi:MAG: hypothetical protein GC160_02945 [Acidobacteria bacterium]|nr:hypothetical protein [Acidobacteriota bacterium]
MRIKSGASVRGLRPEIVLALLAAASVWRELGAADPPTVTAGVDGRHSRGSLHYAGAAVDLRLPRNVEAAQAALSLEAALGGVGGEYDVVLESDHIHVEFQPKEAVDA